MHSWIWIDFLEGKTVQFEYFIEKDCITNIVKDIIYAFGCWNFVRHSLFQALWRFLKQFPVMHKVSSQDNWEAIIVSFSTKHTNKLTKTTVFEILFEKLFSHSHFFMEFYVCFWHDNPHFHAIELYRQNGLSFTGWGKEQILFGKIWTESCNIVICNRVIWLISIVQRKVARFTDNCCWICKLRAGKTFWVIWGVWAVLVRSIFELPEPGQPKKSPTASLHQKYVYTCSIVKMRINCASFGLFWFNLASE